jgi:beta-galactosidase
VPIAKNEVRFKISGPGKIIGVGNGDPSSHEPDKYVGTVSGKWKRSLFNGLAQVIVQSTQQRGEIVLKAVSPGLSSVEISMNSQSISLHNGVPTSQS